MKKLIFLLLLLLLATPCFAEESYNVSRMLLGVVGGSVPAAGGECLTQSLLVDTDATENGFPEFRDGSYTLGQSFTADGKKLYSISLYKGTTNTGTMTCRIGTSNNLSVTYSESVDIICAAGDDTWYEGLSATQTTMTTGTWYVVCESPDNMSIGIDDGNPYAGGSYYYSVLGNYNATDNVSGRDLGVRIKVCD